MKRHTLSYEISQVVPYINWLYFFHAWQVDDRREQEKLREEAEKLLATLEGRYRTHALFMIGDANSDGDDIIFGNHRMPMLRQQTANSGTGYLCMADFIRPLASGKDTMGLFATSVDGGMEHEKENDDYCSLMHKLLADRLAEATAERMHEEVRKHYWGYAANESLTIGEMHTERFDGIRPAVGYPSLPDMSINFVINDIMGLNGIGISLTENGAMRPHASVSGLIISNPQAHYFNIGTIDEEQLSDYARRRGVPQDEMRKFLAANLR